jgi:hypothetical protein
MRAAAFGLILVGGLSASVAVVPSAYASTAGSLHLHQSADCTGPEVAGGSTVALPFSIAFTGFTPNQVGVFTFLSESGATSSNRFSVGDTGTTCSATQTASGGGFLASFSYTDDAGQSYTASVAGVVGTPPPVDPSPTDDPWATPTATASPTTSPGTHHSPTPSKSRTRSATSLPSTGGSGTTGSGARLPTTGTDPRLVFVALTTLVAGAMLYVAARPAHGRRQR